VFDFAFVFCVCLSCFNGTNSSLCVALISHEVVVNCSGIGAHSLVPDPDVFPMKGQVFFFLSFWQCLMISSLCCLNDLIIMLFG